MKVLAGDIGGTNARLAIADVGARSVRLRLEKRFPSRDYPALAPIVQEFLAQVTQKVDRACFGVAGPVVAGTVRASNLPWEIRTKELAADIGIARTCVINDFDAVGEGLPWLKDDDLVTLQHGQRVKHGAIALIGPGSGLGQGLLVWQGGRYVVQPSEGGHASFAAMNALQWGLVEHLRTIHNHVSYERVLSGPGLVYVYGYLAQRGIAREQDSVRAEMEREDPAAVITRHALAQSDVLCERTLDLFVSVLGAQAGNFALAVVATGGVYLAGGIAPRIVDKLRDPRFLDAFHSKGRLSTLLATIPVSVITNTNVGVMGAAAVAARLK